MIRHHPLLALLSLLIPVGLGACGTSQAAQPEWAPPAATSAAPLPAPSSKAEVQDRVQLALLDLSTFHPETAQPTGENDEAWKLIHPCRDNLPSDRQRTAYHERLWDGEKVWIRQYVVGYLKVPGSKLMSELRSTLAKCKTYEESDGRTTTVIRPTPPPVPDSPDVVTFCEQLKGDTIYHQCTALLVRGNFVMEVDASDDGDLEASQALLAQLIPLATDALAQAA
jgi:hypothetical protein